MKHVVITSLGAAARRAPMGITRMFVPRLPELAGSAPGLRLRTFWCARLNPQPEPVQPQRLQRGERSYGQLQPGFLGNTD